MGPHCRGDARGLRQGDRSGGLTPDHRAWPGPGKRAASRARLFQLNEVGTNFPYTKHLGALLPLFKHRSDTSFLAEYTKELQAWRQNMASLEDAKREPIAPQYLMSVMNEAASDEAILTCDSGTIATTLFKDKIQQLRS